MSQSLCIISTKAPYHGQRAREALDTALVSSSFDVPTRLLLMGDGVYQLLANQSPQMLPRKNLSALLKALPLYGIDTIYVDEASLKERHISSGQLLPDHTVLTQKALTDFLSQQIKILSF
ncbi:sulfurtransferase complex subunit TusC [Candidatus Sororendozoicomonas aggregata]|uniref:sulfurtransferase complex subunit TusC n=1 Tax=Candidatus Sororendozoicomonas aggregata TaxID=3073239 RepID=UPI002ED09254